MNDKLIFRLLLVTFGSLLGASTTLTRFLGEEAIPLMLIGVVVAGGTLPVLAGRLKKAASPGPDEPPTGPNGGDAAGKNEPVFGVVAVLFGWMLGIAASLVLFRVLQARIFLFFIWGGALLAAAFLAVLATRGRVGSSLQPGPVRAGMPTPPRPLGSGPAAPIQSGPAPAPGVPGLTPCAACRHLVSTSAAACPSCGHPQGAPSVSPGGAAPPGMPRT